MVHERGVLRRIEHLEQRGRRIAPDVGTHLVHLVEHQQGVARLAALQRVDDAAREGAVVGAAMATLLRLFPPDYARHSGEDPPSTLAPPLHSSSLPATCLP